MRKKGGDGKKLLFFDFTRKIFNHKKGFGNDDSRAL